MVRGNRLRRRVALTCLLLGTPVIAATWAVQRDTDPLLAVVDMLHVLAQVKAQAAEAHMRRRRWRPWRTRTR